MPADTRRGVRTMHLHPRSPLNLLIEVDLLFLVSRQHHQQRKEHGKTRQRRDRTLRPAQDLQSVSPYGIILRLCYAFFFSAADALLLLLFFLVLICRRVWRG